MKPIRKSLSVAALAVALLATACGDSGETTATPQPVAPRVDTLTAELTTVPNEVELPGRARAYAEAEIRPQVTKAR